VGEAANWWDDVAFLALLRAARAAVDLQDNPTTANERLTRVLTETHYARLLLEVDAADTARERCEIAKRFADESGLERAKLYAGMAEGLCEVHAGMADTGLSGRNIFFENIERLRNGGNAVFGLGHSAVHFAHEPRQDFIQIADGFVQRLEIFFLLQPIDAFAQSLMGAGLIFGRDFKPGYQRSHISAGCVLGGSAHRISRIIQRKFRAKANRPGILQIKRDRVR